MSERMGDLASQDSYDPFPRASGIAKLTNAMAGAIDPTEGDFYRSDMYNAQRAAEGIPRPLPDVGAPLIPSGGQFSPGVPAANRAADVLSRYPGHVMSGLLSLPQRAFEASEERRAGGEYDPAPVVEAAMLPMGTGAIAGVPLRTGEVALGAGPTKSLFDYSKIHDVPDVKQFDLPRYDPKRGVSERVADLVKDKRVERLMLEKIEQGKGIGGGAETFYYNEPLRQAFIDELGKKPGQEGFARYMDYVAATSPRSAIEANARNASYYYGLEKQGLPLPDKNPFPYGHMAQQLHRGNVIKNPKPMSFSQNLQGNFAPVTVDAHALKLPAMLKKDPEFLAGSVKLDKNSPTINPTKMFESGDLTMKEALKRPVYWASKPTANEYAAMEQYYKRLAGEAGMTPAQAQAAAWAAGGPMTGLKSVAGDPFMRAVENRANVTAAERGISPAEALSQMIRGKAPLLGLGGVTMGGLAAQDNYSAD